MFVARSSDQGKWHQPYYYAEPLPVSPCSQEMCDDEMRRQQTSMKAIIVRVGDVYPIAEFDPAPNAVSNPREPQNVPAVFIEEEEMDNEVPASSPLTVSVSPSPPSSNYAPIRETFPDSYYPPSPMSNATSSVTASDAHCNSGLAKSSRVPLIPMKFRRNSLSFFL